MAGYIPMPVETVKVASDMFDSGFIIINATDFDEDVHVLYTDEVAQEDVAAAEAAVAPKRKRRS